MKKHLSTIIILWVLAVFFISCNTTKMSQQSNEVNASLYLYQWNLKQLPGKIIPIENVPSVCFMKGEILTVTGNTGCNRFSGVFNLKSENTISFSPLAVSKMACIGENIEQPFLDALNQVQRFEIKNQSLYLYSQNKMLAQFAGVLLKKNPAESAAKLNGNWELSFITGPRIAFSGLYPDHKPTLQFALPDSKVNGNTSCNAFSSIATIEDNSISFADPLSTKMFCEGIGEFTFLTMLKKVNKYAMTDQQTLELFDGELLLMKFVKK